jgi:hypothetical protein
MKAGLWVCKNLDAPTERLTRKLMPLVRSGRVSVSVTEEGGRRDAWLPVPAGDRSSWGGCCRQVR